MLLSGSDLKEIDVKELRLTEDLGTGNFGVSNSFSAQLFCPVRFSVVSGGHIKHPFLR